MQQHNERDGKKWGARNIDHGESGLLAISLKQKVELMSWNLGMVAGDSSHLPQKTERR